jgi:hypothetical protein
MLTLEQARALAQVVASKDKEFKTTFKHLNYKGDRNDLRTAFCRTTLTLEQVQEWLDQYEDEGFQNEISTLCKEWLNKLATPGAGLSRENASEEFNKAFKQQAKSFYKKNVAQIKSPLNGELFTLRAQLRGYVIGQINDGVSPEDIVKNLEIVDEYLKERILGDGTRKGEWVMKAKSPAFMQAEKAAVEATEKPAGEAVVAVTGAPAKSRPVIT